MSDVEQQPLLPSSTVKRKRSGLAIIASLSAYSFFLQLFFFLLSIIGIRDFQESVAEYLSYSLQHIFDPAKSLLDLLILSLLDGTFLIGFAFLIKHASAVFGKLLVYLLSIVNVIYVMMKIIMVYTAGIYTFQVTSFFGNKIYF